MTFKSITLLALVTFFIKINAQDSTTPTSKAGIKAGYNLSAVTFDGDEETGQRHGFHVGFYGESFVAEQVAIQIELLYSQQGYEIEYNSGTFTQKLDYINLPILLKVYPTSNIYLEVGPQVGLAISHKEEFDSSLDIFDIEQEFDPNNFDYGVNLGGGFKTDSGLSLGVRYHLGLGDIYDEGSPKNRVLQFSLGLDF